MAREAGSTSERPDAPGREGFAGRVGLSLPQTPAERDGRGWLGAPAGLSVLVDMSRETGDTGWRAGLARVVAGGGAEVGVAGSPRPELVAAARALGLRRVAWLASDEQLRAPDRLAALIAVGLTDLHLWAHAAGPAAHDFHAGAGSFAVVSAALAQARAAAVEVAVSTLLTRSNARVLAAMPGWLRALGVRAWRIAVPALGGERAADPAVRMDGGAGVGPYDGLRPRLSVAVPHALQALTQAARLGLPAWIEGAPDCLLGPFTAAALQGPPRAYAARCVGCPARAGCPGVDADYLERFAGDELSPAQLRPAGAHVAGASWVHRLVMGTGRLVHVAEDRSNRAGPKGQAARRLPVLAGGGDDR